MIKEHAEKIRKTNSGIVANRNTSRDNQGLITLCSRSQAVTNREIQQKTGFSSVLLFAVVYLI